MSSAVDDAPAPVVRPRSPMWERPGVIDLLLPFARARREAVAAAMAGDWLDALLLTAGCAQVVEDHIHRSEGLFDRVAVHLTGDQADLGRAARVADATAASVRAAHRARPRVGRLLARRDALLELCIDLADAALADDGPARADDARRGRVIGLLGIGSGWPEELAEEALRLPSCFRSFDQHPADVVALAERYVARHPDPDQPVLVAGIRTSGSSMGPLAAAALRRLGARSVGLITLRAGERLDRRQRDAVQAAAGGRVVLIDDPPVSGGTVRDCIRALEAAGMDAGQVTLLLALPDGWELAPFLADHEQIVLPGSAWHLPGRLTADAVADVAARLLAGSDRALVGGLVPVDDPVGAAPGGAPRTPREHRRAAFGVRVRPADAPDDEAVAQVLVVHGTGIGLLGRHDAAVADRLGDLTPDVLGVDDGLLYELVGDPSRADVPPVSVTDAVGYVAARHLALRVPVDRSSAMEGRKAAWEVAAMIVGGALGRADVAARIPLLHPLVRSLLAVDEPSVVDGRISADRWVPAPPRAGGPARVKVDAGEGAFSNRDLWSYDPVLDLAAVGDELGCADEARAEWERLGMAPVEPSRWLLHRLVHAWDRHRLDALPQPDLGRAIGAALVDHVADLYLADLAAPADELAGTDAPWCVVDVDGVLETGVLWRASAPGPLGATVLRACAAHGLRLVPATGRSVAEVAARVRSWGLVAGIAEYGAALVLPGAVVDLRTEDERGAIDVARAWLASQPGIEVDLGHTHSVRAWRRTDGRRVGLAASDVDGARTAAALELVAVPGDDQTDLCAPTTSKATAVRALLARLDPARAGEERPLALAAGDGPADRELLGLGAIAVVPAHAAEDIRALATTTVAGAYQAGLADGLAALLGHAPGACDACRVALPDGPAALMAALGVREAGARGVAPRLARLAAQVARLERA